MEQQLHIELACTTQHEQVRCENHDPAEERPLGELLHRVCAVALITIAGIDALHVRLPIIDPVGQRAFRQALLFARNSASLPTPNLLPRTMPSLYRLTR